MSQERDYVLGTHDDELARLGLQHRVWRPRSLDAWRRAGFTVGQTILDVGCGPGYATMDLAEIVGATGRVIGVDRSQRFLDALAAQKLHRGLAHVDTFLLDLNDAELPAIQADAAWARWVFAFVKHPKELLARVCAAIRPGGVFVIHEYFDYSTWRMAPRCPELEEMVEVVMRSWRADGGEPDIALDLVRWLPECGFEVRYALPIVDCIRPSDFTWHWPKSFIHVGPKRLADIGHLTPQRAADIVSAFERAENTPHTRMFTPAVLEIIAVRRERLGD